MKISTQAKLISTALVAVAIAAPIAHGETGGALLSGSYPQLKAGEGFSFKAPSYWNAGPGYWITVQRTVAPITPRVGVNRSLGVPPQFLGTPQTEPRTPRLGGFNWLDAGIGAAFVAGLGALGLGVFVLVAVRRRHGLAQLEV
jgi:hypothetical protein